MAPSRGVLCSPRVRRSEFPGGRHFWLLLVACLLILPRAAAFHDDDCELAAEEDGAAVDWRYLRELLSRGMVAEAKPEFESLRHQEENGAAQCELGAAAVCLAEASLPGDARACVRGISLQRMLATRWPLLGLLADLQQRLPPGDHGSCDDLDHPSLHWPSWRRSVIAFATDVPPWLAGTTGSDEVPAALNDAILEAQGVVWKASSQAVAHDGSSIADWTSQCSLGVLSAYAVRAAGLVLGESDVYRIVQRAIESAEGVLNHMEAVMRSPWPLFKVLSAMSLMKRTLHDTRLAPRDLRPLEESSEDTRSALWQSAAALLRRAAANGAAAGAPAAVLMTGLPHDRVDHLMNLFKHADRLGYLAGLVLVPLRGNLSGTCEQVTALFTVRRPERVPVDWAPCLPFVSRFAQRAQYLYLHMALQLGLPVLWFDFHVVFIQSPMPWLRATLQASGSSKPLYFYHPCRLRCEMPEAAPDVYMADEFYGEYLVKPSLMLMRPTPAARRWLEMLSRWVCSYPFAEVKRGLQYLVHPDQPDAVPSASFLPAISGVPELVLGELDAEQQFVGTDGWFGEADRILSFEISHWIKEEDRVQLLESLLAGSPEEILIVILAAQKFLSPLRPTERLYRQFSGDASFPSECTWVKFDKAFIGGYAAGVEEEVFRGAEKAKCSCLQLGPACRGVTCEQGLVEVGKPKGEGGLGCTLRHGDPELMESPAEEFSHVKVCEGGSAGCDAAPVTRIVHVNFADGCCESEQHQSSETALQFGADESRPLRGDFLDAEFRRKNHVLLTFNRTPELTQHKTPTGKIGYYVWKPYAILKTMQDPDLPWDTTVIAWTDAGIHFISDMRPLIRKYLKGSDVAATRTPMLEGDFSKRDAFILLDADYQSIMETNQIATGFILVRKTRLAINFLEKWLAACEERRIMTEEPSVLGLAEYPSYKNNNDDQTGFSLLFKRHGFTPFSVGERDAVVYTGRNLAKFIKASDDFALGVKSDREAYLKAAEEAATKPLQRSGGSS